jgi:guanylate kinase
MTPSDASESRSAGVATPVAAETPMAEMTAPAAPQDDAAAPVTTPVTGPAPDATATAPAADGTTSTTLDTAGRTALARLTVLAGPTAVGKGTVAAYIREHWPQVCLSVSATTRRPRPGEIDGVHYYFVDDETFDRMIADGELLEFATVHNSHRYGTPRGPVERALREGRPVLLEIDLQGARQVRRNAPDARLVFLSPPSWEELVHRLIGRGTETPEEQHRRLETAKVELASRDEFDEEVVNDRVARAAREVVHLMGLPTSEETR